MYDAAKFKFSHSFNKFREKKKKLKSRNLKKEVPIFKMNQVETEQNLNLTERVHSMEQKLATVSSHMLDMARINNEYRQRITELEVAGQQQQHHHQQQWQEVKNTFFRLQFCDMIPPLLS